MVKSISKLLLLISLTLPAFGQMFDYGDVSWFGVVATPAVESCSTYNTTNAWDNFVEGFQTVSTGYESNTVWTAGGTTANVYPAADSSALTTYKPAGGCSQAFKLVVPTDGTETYIKGDLGASQAVDLDTVQTDIYFSIYVETAPDSSEYYHVFNYNSGGGVNTGGVFVRLRNVSGLGLQAIGTGSATTIGIAAGQWYVCRLSLDTAQAAGGTSFTVWSNGSQIGSVTLQRSAGEDLRYLYVGAPVELDANDSGTVWFDLIAVKTN